MKILRSAPVVYEKQLSNDDIALAFRVGEQELWFRAALQLLEAGREDAIDAASTHVANGFKDKAIASIGGYTEIQKMIEAFKNLRANSVDRIRAK